MRYRALRRFLLASAIGLAAAPAGARADARSAFSIPAGPLKQAATTFAIQGRVSIDLSDTAGCGPSRGFSGHVSAQTALKALLAGTGCDVRRVDSKAYQIVRRPPPAPVPTPAPAAPTDIAAEPSPLLSELVVVATRRPTLADRLAYSVSVMDERAGAVRGVKDANDLALVVPAMTVTNLGPGRDKVILRGLSDGPLTGQTQSMVGIYLDDVRLTYNAPDPDLLMIDVAQVEVLRGPQGALYGAGSLGGVLQLTTHRPDPTGFDAWVAASGATTRGGEGGGRLSAMVNAPLLDGRAAARVVAYAERQGGYIDDRGQERSNVNHTRRTGMRTLLSAPLAGGWSAETGAAVQAITSDDTQYANPAVGRYARRNRLAEPHDNDFLAAHLGLKGPLFGQDAKLTLATVRHDIGSRYDASAAPPIVAPSNAAVAFDDKNHVEAVVAEASLASRGHGAIQWQAGAFLARTRQGRDADLTIQAAQPALLARETRRDVLGEAALFGEAIGDLGRGWSLTVGGRLFATSTEVSSVALSLGKSAAFRNRQSYVGFAPKAVVSFAPTDTMLLYVQAAEGYRSGGFNTALLPAQRFDTAGGEPQRRYDGDELWSFEAGAKLRLLDGRLRLRTAAFAATWKNIQSDQLLPSGLPYTANLGDGRNMGLEFEGSYVQGGLRLDASFLLNKPELESVNPAFPGRADLSLAGAPKGSAALGIDYERALSRDWRIGWNGGLSYVGRSSLSFDADTAPSMGGYATARAAMRLRSDRLSIGLSVENLLDSSGDTFAYGNPFTLKLSRQATPQRPRSILIEITRRY